MPILENNPTPHGYDFWKYDPTNETDKRAIQTYLQTVRDKCTEAGIDERDYWLADPAKAIAYRPECLSDQLDQIEADLAAARQQQAQDVIPN